MHNNSLVYKGIIKEFDENLDSVSVTKAMYKIINIENKYYFAEEISTGCIFPIYYGLKQGNIKMADHFSHLQSGKYFAFYPLKPSTEKLFEYIVNEQGLEQTNIKTATYKEQQEYLDYQDINPDIKEKIKKMEKENIYAYELDYIKEIIEKQKKGILNLPKIKPPRENKEIDFKEISNYGYNLLEESNQEELINREEEIKTIIKRTFINNKSIILVGPSGSGKTSIVKTIASKIKKNENKWLKNKTIFYLNISSLVGGTRYRGEFEERMNTFINFCKQHKGNLIIFIDEIHNIYGLGKSQDTSFDAMNILKQALDNQDITIIGTTTNEEFLKYMANDEAFLRRCSRVNIEAPTKELNKEIIYSYIKKLEKKYQIKLNLTKDEQYTLIEYLLNITDIKNQRVIEHIKISNPTITKNIIDEFFSEALYNESTEVTINDICFAILNCENLNPTFKKEKAEELKQTILKEKQEIKKNKKILKLEKV